MGKKKMKKSLVGWACKDWHKQFLFFTNSCGENGMCSPPWLSKEKERVDKKVRITIEEI